MQGTQDHTIGNSHRTGPHRRACPSTDSPAQPTSTPRFGCPLAAALGILACCCVVPARGAPPSSDQLVGMVTDAVRSNYALIESASGWRESFSREVLAVVLNGPVAADTFQLDLPPGTRVSDNTRQAIYAASALPTQRPIGRWAYILGIVHLSILLVCVRLYKAKKLRSLPNAAQGRNQ